MIILKPTQNPQLLQVIPREYNSSFTLEIRDDTLNEIATYSITGATISGNYLKFSNKFNLKPALVEGHFYDLELSVDTDVFYKDRIFCTDQTIEQKGNKYYNLNEGQYTSYNDYDNTYIVR